MGLSNKEGPMLCCDILNIALANSAHEYITEVKVYSLGSFIKNWLELTTLL